jgi:hypothetical protein
MEEQRIRKEQEDKLNEFLIKEKEKEIELLKSTTRIKVETLERNLKYLKGLNRKKRK